MSDAPIPVTPAAEVPVAPSAALDPIASEPTILDKALAQAKPYAETVLEKVQATTKPYTDIAAAKAKPYTDIAAAKAKEVIDRIEGTTPVAPVTREVSIDGTTATSTTSTAPGTGTGNVTPTSAAEKAKGIFEQGLSAVQSTFVTITNTIESKTTTADHPGLITQVTNAVHKGVDKAEAFMNQPVGNDAPVTTTTNTVPHIESGSL
ncbi:hypothetical protein P7C73_g4676, partial [Tremellales sp. Uapishka_1]